MDLRYTKYLIFNKSLQDLKILVETVVFYFIVDTLLLFGNFVSEPPNFQTVYLHNCFINFNICRVWIA